MKYNIKFKSRWRCGYRLWILSRASKKQSGIFRVHLIEATLTCIWLSKLVEDRVEPSDVFLAFAVDQGLNVVNAIEALNIPVVVCNAHRLNTGVCWMLGIAGSDKTCKNPVLEKIMKKLAACMRKFSHSAANSSV